MSNTQPPLPPELAAQLFSYMREENGNYEIVDKEGLIRFIVANADAYPHLLKLIGLNEEYAIEHFQKTGEVIPGVRITSTETEEGSNVTKLNVYTSANTAKK